ncbi:MAG: 2-nitropropane dioxygenase, partial [Verrucomicrobia bacterium]|nr:2-nitropropane dioxygenase [Verrucomicrobiota bacterium]
MKQKAQPLGWWSPNGTPPIADVSRMREAVWNLNQPVTIVDKGGLLALGEGGRVCLGEADPREGALPVTGYAAAMRVEGLGDPCFCEDHGVRFPYVAGAMANGIASEEMVIALSQA